LLEELSTRSCPLGYEYDPDIHHAIDILRILEGSLPQHARQDSAVNLFSPAGETKYWVKASTLAFGFFFYYTLDMAICPYLVSIFGMKIWHPTTGRGGQTFGSRSQSVSIAARFKKG